MSQRETRSGLVIKCDAAKRLVLWYCFSGVRPHFLVSEYPKSGGSWVSQLISSYLQIPFPRNQSVGFFQQTSLLHGHHLYSPFFKNAVYVIRDGRDAMVSAYFHLLFVHDRNNHKMVDGFRKKIRLNNYEEVYSNMPKFIDYMFTTESSKLFHFSWSDFVNSIDYERAIVVKYEDLVEDTSKAIINTIEKLTGEGVKQELINSIIEKYSFLKQAGRNPGEENKSSFLRNGIVGDWVSKFSPESRQVFHHYGGKELILTGYEPDSTWALVRS